MNEEFEHPRLAAIYDVLDADRSDLVPYLDLVRDTAAERVLDLGCGTGLFALLLAGRGMEVIGLDPAAASLAVARAKQGADRVRWIDGDATAIDVTDLDVITMTANAAQCVCGDDDWAATLRAVHGALRPGGVFAFETRDPAARAWERWTREDTFRITAIPCEGGVQSWVETVDIALPLVTLRCTYCFSADGQTLTSELALRFRERAEVESDLRDAGFTSIDIRGAPDRPGKELVFLAHRDS